jgi:hypothetical protein
MINLPLSDFFSRAPFGPCALTVIFGHVWIVRLALAALLGRMSAFASSVAVKSAREHVPALALRGHAAAGSAAVGKIDPARPLSTSLCWEW